MEIKVLFEDSNILAIDKPSGILVHPVPEQARYGTGPNDKSDEETIYDIFVKKYSELEIVHRLDRETSGVMLLAKNANAHSALKSQFKKRNVKKIYHCIVEGWMKEDFGTIDKPIGRSPRDFRRRSAGRGARGQMREAITFWKVFNKFEEDGSKYSYLEVRPKTGRTHQIRVHMKYLNRPVVCDSLYNPKGLCSPEVGRLALHAKEIEFKNLKGELVKVESPLPGFFDRFTK